MIVKKRIFLAVDISEQLRRQVEEWREKYQDWPVRWLPSKSLHITLVPPWEESDEGRVVESLY